MNEKVQVNGPKSERGEQKFQAEHSTEPAKGQWSRLNRSWKLMMNTKQNENFQNVRGVLNANTIHCYFLRWVSLCRTSTGVESHN